MNLFIEHPAARTGEMPAAARTRRPAGAVPSAAAQGAAADLEEPTARDAERIAPVRRTGYSLEQETYRRELDFDRERTRRRRRAGAARAVAVALLVPLLLVAAFLAAYVLTCVLQGATPGEAAGMLGDLAHRVLSLPGAVARG